MTQVELSGPIAPPASGKKPSQLVILCHGYGANGQDLIGLAEPWRDFLPDAAFVAPDAPEGVPGFAGGFQWWGIGSFSEKEREKGVASAAPSLDAFIDTWLTDTELDESQLALVGFSQGTMMALHVGLQRAKPVACIVGFSGTVAAPNLLAESIKSRPPTLLIHGDSDEMIPPTALDEAANFLRDQKIEVKTHMSQGVGHGIGPDGVRLGAKFLVNAFALQASGHGKNTATS